VPPGPFLAIRPARYALLGHERDRQRVGPSLLFYINTIGLKKLNKVILAFFVSYNKLSKSLTENIEYTKIIEFFEKIL